jgi:hypothetical protein
MSCTTWLPVRTCSSCAGRWPASGPWRRNWQRSGRRQRARPWRRWDATIADAGGAAAGCRRREQCEAHLPDRTRRRQPCWAQSSRWATPAVDGFGVVERSSLTPAGGPLVANRHHIGLPTGTDRGRWRGSQPREPARLPAQVEPDPGDGRCTATTSRRPRARTRPGSRRPRRHRPGHPRHHRRQTRHLRPHTRRHGHQRHRHPLGLIRPPPANRTAGPS